MTGVAWKVHHYSAHSTNQLTTSIMIIVVCVQINGIILSNSIYLFSDRRGKRIVSYYSNSGHVDCVQGKTVVAAHVEDPTLTMSGKSLVYQ